MKVVSHSSFGAYTPPKDGRENAWAPKKGTLIIDNIPELQDMQNLAANFVGGVFNISLEFKIGLAKLHFKDDFIRKKGLEVATANLKPVVAQVDSLIADKESLRVGFRTDLGDFVLKYLYGKRVQLDGENIIDKGY